MRLYVVADGGDARVGEPHTLAAYLGAVEAGADAVGISVRLSADAVAVVSRAAVGPSGAVHARPAAEQTGLGAVVAELPTGLGLEVRLASPEGELVDAVGTALAEVNPDRVVLTSPYAAVLAHAATVLPDLIRGLLLPVSPPDADPELLAHEAVSRARLARADAVHLQPTQVSRVVLMALDEASIGVHVWGAHDEQAVDRCTAWGLTRFATSDLPALLRLRDG